MEIQILREAVHFEPGLVIAPGEQAIIEHPPEELHLTLTPTSAAAWYGLRAVSSQTQSMAEDDLLELLSKGRPTRRAALTCALEGVKFANEIEPEDTNRQEKVENLTSDLELTFSGISSAQTCGGAIQKAERELAQRGESRAPITLKAAQITATNERPGFIRALGATLLSGAQKAVRVRIIP